MPGKEVEEYQYDESKITSRKIRTSRYIFKPAMSQAAFVFRVSLKTGGEGSPCCEWTSFLYLLSRFLGGRFEGGVFVLRISEGMARYPRTEEMR